MKMKMYSLALVLGCVALSACGGDPNSKRLSAGNMHPEGNFDGVYHSNAYGRMEFTQNGGSVMGLYEGERHFGKIEGTVEGDLMEFRWTEWKEDLNGKVRESSGHGYFRYEVVEEGDPMNPRLAHFLKGEWGYGSDNAGNKWEAVKFPPKSKKILKAREVGGVTADMDAEYSSGGKSPFDSGSAPSGGNSSDGGSDTPSNSGNLDNSGGNDAVEDLF